MIKQTKQNKGLFLSLSGKNDKDSIAESCYWKRNSIAESLKWKLRDQSGTGSGGREHGGLLPPHRLYTSSGITKDENLFWKVNKYYFPYGFPKSKTYIDTYFISTVKSVYFQEIGNATAKRSRQKLSGFKVNENENTNLTDETIWGLSSNRR